MKLGLWSLLVSNVLLLVRSKHTPTAVYSERNRTLITGRTEVAVGVNWARLRSSWAGWLLQDVSVHMLTCERVGSQGKGLHPSSWRLR